MSDHETENLIPMLAQAFAAFNKSADKLSTVYGHLAGSALEQVPHLPIPEFHTHSLLIGALECIPDGVLVVDREGSVIAINKAARELIQLDGNDGTCPDIFKETLITAMPGNFQKRLPSGIEAEINATPVINNSGSVIGAVGILKQAGTRKQEDASRRSFVASPESSLSPMLAAMSDIIMNIAHRMRSPLSAIQLFAELLKQDLDANKQETVDDILVGVHSLDAVLSNLLSFAQPVKPRFKEVDLAVVLDESLLFAAPAIKQQAISLVKRYFHGELRCYGDLEQLKQVCFNLILNAIQAMPEGGELHINASYIREADAGEYVSMEIQDNGGGIADEDMNRIFTPFFSTKEGGTGLGLCVVYKVIQAHQGTIRISSDFGRGTVVSVQLPSSSMGE